MLLAACLVVRDEARLLPSCLDSLRAVADEIVVHDTGSTDATVAIARAAGARVSSGRWTDDFAAARNEALERCAAEWVLSIDADERFVGDAAALLSWLRTMPAGPLAASVEIENLLDDGSSYRHRSVRLFRRGTARWRGRVHEQVVPAPGVTQLRAVDGAPIRLVHEGYLGAAIARTGKLERNVRLALASLEACTDDADRGVLELHAGRALLAAGRPADAAAHLAVAGGAAPATVLERTALRFAVAAHLATGDVAAAGVAVARLRSLGSGVADLLGAQVALQSGRPEEALALLAGREDVDGEDPELVDDEGRSLPRSFVPLHRGLASALLERWDDAADALRDAVVAGAVGGNLPALVLAWRRAGRSAAMLGRSLPLPVAVRVAADRFGDDRAGDGRVDEGGVDAGPSPDDGDGTIAGALLEVRGLPAALEPEVLLGWAAAVRGTDGDARCPLVALASDDGADRDSRSLAAALALSAFGDLRGATALTTAVPGAARDIEQLLVALGVAPGADGDLR